MVISLPQPLRERGAGYRSHSASPLSSQPSTDHRTEPHGQTLHDYDIVYGSIANDRVGAQIARYKQGYITFDEFLRRIQYIKGITFQYAFCTQRAIDKLQKIL